jgi:sRNA-binding regulator protein Hfq
MGPILIEEPIDMSKRIALDDSAAKLEAKPNLSLAVLEPQQTTEHAWKAAPSTRRPRTTSPNSTVRHFAAITTEDHGSNRQAELFYLQKQIQLQTQMVFILEDGARVQGVVEWYDRNSIKVRGKSRMLLYKSAIKYLYKAGEVGTGPEE